MAAPKARSPRAKKPRALDPVDLLQAAAKGEIVPMLLVTGQDWFSRDAVLAELRKTIVAEGFEGFDASTAGGEEITGEGLVNQADMLAMGGMAGGSRYILVRRAEKIKERELEPLSRYAASPGPGSCLVLVFDEAKGAVLTALKS